MSGSAETFQISLAQAETYESSFVPAIFADWAPHTVDAAGVGPGAHVLDAACGTGIVARVAAERAGRTGTVTGLDLNDAMLTVARRLRPDIRWQQGDVADMPFVDGSFDVVLCQSAMMFFPDPARALREMRRVVRTDGTVAVQVYAGLDEQPGYRPLIDLVAEHAGPDAVAMLGTYWVHGNLDMLRALFTSAGLDVIKVRSRSGVARFGSIDEFVRTEVESTPVATMVSDAEYAQILRAARDRLREFRTDDRRVAVPLNGHIVVAKPR